MKCCLFILSFLAVVIAILYYYVSQLDENPLVEYLRPSFDKHYKLFKKDKNVQKVMRAVGVNPMNVHLGHSVPNTIVLKVEKWEKTPLYTLTQYYSLTENTLRFRVGEEFQETCVHNGVLVKSVITQFRNNLTHIQVRENIRYPLIIRRVFRSEELIVEIRAGDVVSTMVYFPVHEPKNSRDLT